MERDNKHISTLTLILPISTTHHTSELPRHFLARRLPSIETFLMNTPTAAVDAPRQFFSLGTIFARHYAFLAYRTVIFRLPRINVANRGAFTFTTFIPCCSAIRTVEDSVMYGALQSPFVKARSVETSAAARTTPYDFGGIAF